MAEEEVVAPAASPVPSDYKRKYEDLESQPTESDADNADAAVSEEGENKRPRQDESLAGSNANGHQEEQVSEDEKETGEGTNSGSVVSEDGEPLLKDVSEAIAGEQASSEVAEPAEAKEVIDEGAALEKAEEPSQEIEEPSKESTEQDVYAEDKQPDSVDTAPQDSEIPSDKQDASPGQQLHTSAADTTIRKIEVPNNKVGVLIGKAGDTIRYLQNNSGAKIQIMRDAEADPQSATRSVELIGSVESIEKAERLINAVIAEADAGGSPALVARGLSPAQATVGSEQIQMQVPNEKVGLIIGRGGETIKGMQTRSGARIQLIPQHLPEGDDSKERTVQVTGDKRQIELAQELIKEAMSQIWLLPFPWGIRTSDCRMFNGLPVRPSTGGYGQQGYRQPRGSSGPPQWSQRGSHFGHPTSHDYQHRGPYPSHNQSYAPTPYGNYPQHMAPRSGYGSGWEQRPHHHGMQGPPPHNGSYDYYGGQGGHFPDAPPSTQHPGSVPPQGAGPSPVASMGSSQVNYNYGQPQGQEYGHQAPYAQVGPPQQGYGQGYDESKYENRGPAQYPYGGHMNSQQTYPQSGAQPNYGAPQQYGKPPLYGMPPQGQPPQSYGHARPGDMQYQGSTPAQSYGTNMPSQQPYPYASSGPSQAAYPTYGSAPAADNYSHPPPAGQVYAPPSGQPSYVQPVSQPAASYAPSGYGSYPTSQQAYTEQPAPQSAGYGYQAPQDPAYSSTAAPAYSAAPGGQPGFVQPAPTQTGYEQSNPQSAGYAAVQASAPVAAYAGKTLSPQQPTYPQYDSTQVYGAPR